MEKYRDSFLFESSSKVKSVYEKDSFIFAEVEETIFYPGGGGQPCDRGIIKNNSFFGEVIEASKKGEIILHKIKAKSGTLRIGDTIDMMIDKERRVKLIKMHTGEHILFRSLQTIMPDTTLEKIDLDEEESSLFISAGEMSWEKLFMAEELANKIINEDRPIIEKEYPKSDAVMMEKIRIKPERIKSETVRVLEVKDFDWSACAGTHAKSAGFVGDLLITRFSFSKGSWELRFRTDAKKELFRLSAIARKSASLFETDINNVPVFIRKQKEDFEAYKDKFRKLSFKMLDNYKAELVNGINFIYNFTEEIEKKQLADKSAELLKEKTIICFANKENEKATILLNISKDLGLDAPEILNNTLSKFGGKGGGRDGFAMGSIGSEHCDEFVKLLKDSLSK